jgi:phosphohistidine swiveling domain-containing protein
VSESATRTTEFGLPAVIGAKGATVHIPDGALVDVDAVTGVVRVVRAD